MASIFTKIVNDEIPAYKVAETDDFLAFLDAFPVVKGHVLVIPKKETDYIFDLEDGYYVRLQLFAKKVALGIKSAIPCKRIGVMVLGMEVPHAHIHLVPIQTEKDLFNFSEKIKIEPEEMKKVAEKIAEEIEL